jgi:transposase
MLDRIDTISADIDALTARIETLIAPFAGQVAQLDDITGVGRVGAQEIIAEVGVDMTRFPTAGHLVSWAKFAPIDKKSAGRGKAGPTGKGNPWLAATLGEVVAGLSRTNTFLGARYRRLVKRRGKNRSIVAVANSALTIVWYLLGDPARTYRDLGVDHYEATITGKRRQRQLDRTRSCRQLIKACH